MRSVASDSTNDESETKASTVESSTTVDSSNDFHKMNESMESSHETAGPEKDSSQVDKVATEESTHPEVVRVTAAPETDGGDTTDGPEVSGNDKPRRDATIAKGIEKEIETLARNVNWALQYENLMDPLEDRKVHAKLRLTQGLTYQVLLEDRIKELESKLADVELRLGIRTEEVEVEEPRPKVVPLKDRWQISIGHFKSLEFSLSSLYPAKPPHIIDVLKGDMTALPLTKPWVPHSVTLAQLPSNEHDSSATASLDGKVERICINSDLICDAFTNVMDKDLAPKRGATHIRPFKALLCCEEEIRRYASKLRLQVADRGNDKTSRSRARSSDAAKTLTELPLTPEESVSPQSNPISDEPTEIDSLNVARADEDDDRDAESLKHIDALLSFLDDNLAGDLKSYKTFQSGLTSEGKLKIAFADLWKLFAPGNIIYSPEGAQALQVLAVHGGRPALRWRWKHSRFSRERIDDLEETQASDRGSIANIEAKDDPSPFTITCFFLDFDGEVIGPVQKTISLDPYEGQRDITALSVYPIQYASCQGSFSPIDVDPAASSSYPSVRDRLHERGKLFAKLINPKEVAHRDYQGLTLDKVRVHIDSDVIIDYDLYLQQHPDQRPVLGLREPMKGDPRETQESAYCICTCDSKTCCDNEETNLDLYDDRQVDEYRTDEFIAHEGATFAKFRQCQARLKDEHCILFPNSVPGFVLKTREWCSLDLNKIRPLKTREQSFNDLILPKEYKDMVESLVRMHAIGPKPVEGSKSMSSEASNNIEQREDLVRGKGKGLIILLHGVPGVGKTSTAECVAEYTKRPLYALTCGDIGESPGEVQQKLSEAFKFAHRWGCVMLLDEADVFLQARDRTDMNRNAVVSVFLRTLEYYSGILFLTTNKVGVFDEAFKSRIHVSLYYKALDSETAKQIWQVNLRRIKETKKHITFSEKKIMKWVEKHQKRFEKKGDKEGDRPWNGRQIHNAVQTAVALAAFLNNNVMTPDHLKAVAAATKEFDDYLKVTHGDDDIGVAQREKYRGDDVFNQSQTPVSARKSKKKSSKKKEPSSDESSSSNEESDSSDED